MVKLETTLCKNLVGGEWVVPENARLTDVVNPATGELLARVPDSDSSAVNAAVAAAAAAFPAWKAVPVAKRIQYLFRYKALLDEHADEIAALVTADHGKTLDDAKSALRRGIEVVDFACGMPTLLMGQILPDIAAGIDGALIREPLGVCVGITPFNFPAMIPLWMFPVAVAAGNTFVLKPSPMVPRAAIRLLELALEAGFPPGVINLVHGGQEAATALINHPDVRAVSFVGSSPVAKAVYTAAAAAGKRVQALGGAKNYLTVMPDADLDQAVHGITQAAFGSAGERCLATSVVLAVEPIGDELVRRLTEAAAAFRVGNGAVKGTDMGPLVSSAARQRVVGYLDRGAAEGAVLVLDGRKNEVTTGAGCFVGLSIFDHVQPNMSIAREEIFGPVLSVMRVRDLDEAIAATNATEFGNAASIFTRDGKAAHEFRQRVEVGMLGVNVGVAGPMAFFSFGGRKGSFYGDLRVHGREGVEFYTQQKSVTTRWF